MRFGFVLPGGTEHEQLELAALAEASGWDGVFVWEAAYGVDAWCLLSAMATRTTSIRLGTMLTPLPWRRPWKLASQVATLDRISGGRAILGVGLGAVDPQLGTTGEVESRGRRARLLDEGIDVITGLWSGKLTHDGRQHHIDLRARADLADFAPVQRPRPPIWVVGRYPSAPSMRRVARADGWIAEMLDRSTETVRDGVTWLRAHGANPGVDVVVEGETPSDRAAAEEAVGPWSEAGATWWLETRWGGDGPRLADSRERLSGGPPPT